MATEKQNDNMKLSEETTMDKKNDTVNTQEKATDLEDWSFVSDSAQHDLTLIVEEHKIHVPKVVLSLASPVFRAMFQSDFKEKNLQEVEFPGKKYEDFAEFLRCIFPNKLKYVTRSLLYQVLPYVMEYQVAILQERCQTLLIQIVRGRPGTVFRHIGLAQLYDMEDLRKMCVYIASESSLQCFEEAPCLISAKTLFQIHILKLKRHNLDTADDQILLKYAGVEVQKRDVRIYDNMRDHVVLKTVDCRQILEQYLQSSGNQYNHSEKIRRARLAYRYMPDKLKQYTDTLPRGSPEADSKLLEELSLLPESVKQSRNVAEYEQQYFYPALPDVPKLVFSNEK